jgi:hypothetical protein
MFLTSSIKTPRLVLLCAFFFMVNSGYFAQEKDSLRLYKRIKKVAYKYQVTRWAYDAVFRDPEPKEYPVQPVSKEEKNVNPYLKYRGCIIRHINITVYDPFGYSVTDTLKRKINAVQKAGNKLHITTHKFIINNRLLFKENDSLDALRISESERILRDAVFVNDAKIYLSRTKSRDSVDVNVMVQDKWPVEVPIAVTDMGGDARLKSRNLLGFGQQFEQYVGYKKTGEMDYKGFYNISNIDNTFISSQLGYISNVNETNVYLLFDKPFYSFFATWAGGVYVNHTWTTFLTEDTLQKTTHTYPVNIFGYDVWAAKNFKLSNRKTLFNQSTNLVVGGRYYDTRYLARPSGDIDTGRVNLNSSAFIGNIGFAVQQYYKDKYIYRFGANEDVPEGLIVQFMYGGLKREGYKIRYYNGIEIGRAKHFQGLGYLTATFAYGIFYNVKVPNDVTTIYKIYYFSELMRNGRWFFRQFLNYNLVHGENKLMNQKLTVRSDDIYGFSNGSLTGNTKMFLNSETVAYMPYNLIGFKFAPVLAIGLGMVGDPENRLYKSRLYQGYSLGLMVRNENLLSSTFQVSVGLYPFLPDKKGLSIVYNPVTSFTLRVRAFSVSRPDFVAY